MHERPSAPTTLYTITLQLHLINLKTIRSVVISLEMLKYSTNLIVSCYFFWNIQTFTPYFTHYTHHTFSQLLLQYKSTLNFFILIFSFFPIWNSVFHFPSLLSISLISLWELLNISNLFSLDTHVAYKVIFLFYFYFKLFCNVWFLLLYKF